MSGVRQKCGSKSCVDYLSALAREVHGEIGPNHTYIHMIVSNVRLETRFKIQEPEAEICQVSTLNLCILNFVPTDVYLSFVFLYPRVTPGCIQPAWQLGGWRRNL